MAGYSKRQDWQNGSRAHQLHSGTRFNIASRISGSKTKPRTRLCNCSNDIGLILWCFIDVN